MATSGFSSGNDHHLSAGIRVDHPANIGVAALQVDRRGLVHGHKRQPGCPGLQARDHAEMRIFFPFQLSGFDRGANSAQRTDARVAHVGKDDFPGAAGRDHLVIDQVRGGAGQNQVFASLADDFMTGREGDQVGKTGQIDTISIMDIAGDCFRERTKFCHGARGI